jgi:hypothetical protein
MSSLRPGEVRSWTRSSCEPREGSCSGWTRFPRGRREFLDGRSKGATPLDLSKSPSGSYALRISRFGFKEVPPKSWWVPT